ncbi:MAG: hypothetical protein VX368_00030 [Thermoproteota archaeon]|jgi:hypothetical protein|tara:strand:- start:1174 stop:1518 length:345 start_codon:yes stop_codon:yes gene_type:complete
MKKSYFFIGFVFLLSGILLYLSVLNQINEIDEFIIVEEAKGNIIKQTNCVWQIGNQCEVRGVEYSGKLMNVVEEMNDRMNNTKSLSRLSFLIGSSFILYSTYKELSRAKQYLLD